MTADELARLELARRAFAATRPNEAEVSAGVRRTRLALRRNKLPRKSWFGKGLVLVTLAIGGLAYAKPQGVSDIVARVEQAAGFRSHGRVGSAVTEARQRPSPLPAAVIEQPDTAVEPQAVATSAPAAPRGSSHVTTPRLEARRHANNAAASTASAPETSGGESRTDPAAVTTTDNVSSWGRVGQALARGDEQAALSALNELAESDDPRTRDKADLGRAQLLLAHGQQEQGCALARQLTHRRAGGRIERQALALLKSCER